MKAPLPSLSVIVPIHDEAENILVLADELVHNLGRLPDWECIWVDDASADTSRAFLRTLTRRTSHHRVLLLPEHRGQSAALLSGARLVYASLPSESDARRLYAALPHGAAAEFVVADGSSHYGLGVYGQHGVVHVGSHDGGEEVGVTLEDEIGEVVGPAAKPHLFFVRRDATAQMESKLEGAGATIVETRTLSHYGAVLAAGRSGD